jgi:aminotransferase
MVNSLSNNVNNIEISGIRKFFNKVQQVPSAISLTLGQPDFIVPYRIKEVMIKAIEDNKTTYTLNAGIVELRQAISEYLKGMNINYLRDEICVTVGGSEGLLSVFTALINPSDVILIPTPAYPAYESCVRLLGGCSVNYGLNSDFTLNCDNIEALIIKEKPKALVISFPSNPTGAVLNKNNKEELYKLIKKYNIVVITDEIYSSLCFADDFYSISQCTDIKNNVILVSGFSKMFSMTGLRIGYVCATERFMNNIMKVHQYNVSCAPSISQWGAYEGLKNCMEDVLIMRNEFIKRRDYVYNRLIAMGLKVVLPKGAFYIFPSIIQFNLSSEDFCERMLREGKVAVVPGSAFGIGGEGYLRISFSYNIETLKEALDRMEVFLRKLNDTPQI